MLGSEVIANVIDKRKRQYRWKRIQAIIEAAEHDNVVDDADQIEPGNPDKYVIFDQRDAISLADAIRWAGDVDYSVVLYLYDEGAN